MRIAYLDCASGISGDMTLAALVDAGVELGEIQAGVDSLGLPSCRLVAKEVDKRGFRALQIIVEHEPEHVHRRLADIEALIGASALTQAQQSLALRIFHRLATAEAKVHGTTIDRVHFHEVGAVDSIADIVGAAIGWDLLSADQVVCSAIPTGGGTVEIAHGRVAIPAPATAELLRNVPLMATDVEGELTTPTGAAIAATLAGSFAPIPAMCIERIGYGAGSADFAQPNLLRLFIGKASSPDSVIAETVCMLRTNVDDASGEIVGHCAELLWNAGALDVAIVPIQMKKGRPGTAVEVMCRPADADVLEAILFRETTTLGVRRGLVQRHALPRESAEVVTAWGPVAGVCVRLPGGGSRFSPEYEACKRIAETHDVALQEVYAAAQKASESLDIPARPPREARG